MLLAENLGAWQPDRLSKPEELRFSYEEEGAPEHFFVPYIWSLVVSSTTIPWNLHAIALFQPVMSAKDAGIAEEQAASQSLQQTLVEQTDDTNGVTELHV